jgi:hypothetical protein
MSICLLLGAIAVTALTSAANAQASAAWPQVGMLNCKLNPNIGFVIAGHQSMEYSFTPNAPDQPQRYDGAINRVGLDVGLTTDGALGWAVFAPTVGAPFGSLAGEYVVVSGDVVSGLAAEPTF